MRTISHPLPGVRVPILLSVGLYVREYSKRKRVTYSLENL